MLREARQMVIDLKRERDRIHEEIRSYPPPIPACDEHFSHLLGERARVARELARVRRELRSHLREGVEGRPVRHP